jgi:hypothetical protein
MLMDFVTLVDRNHSLLAEATEARAKTRQLMSRGGTGWLDLDIGRQPSQHWPLDWSRNSSASTHTRATQAHKAALRLSC